MRLILFILIMIINVNFSFSQKKLIKKAIEEQSVIISEEDIRKGNFKNKNFYVDIDTEKDILLFEDLEKYCTKNNIQLFNVSSTKEVVFGNYRTVINYFEFLPNEFNYQAKYNQYIENCKSIIKKHFIANTPSTNHWSPCPNIGLSDYNYLIGQCSGQEYLVEDAFFNLVPNCISREKYLTISPNSVYSVRVKKDIEDIASGKKKEIGIFDAMQQVIDKVGEKWDSSDAGQALKLIGRMSGGESGQCNKSIYVGIDIDWTVENDPEFSITSEDGKVKKTVNNKMFSSGDHLDFMSANVKGKYFFTYKFNDKMISGNFTISDCNMSFYKIFVDSDLKNYTVKSGIDNMPY